MTNQVLRQISAAGATVALLATLTLGAAPACADVKLPAMFTDHAVLQRDMPLPVWGWADPGEEVIVTIAGQTHKAKADDKGKWRVTLEPLKVGDPLTLVVTDASRSHVATAKDILVGRSS